MKKSPTVDMNRRAANLRIVVSIWIDAMFFAPERLTNGGRPQPGEDEEDRAPLRVVLVDEVLDVEHPADRDRGVAGPGGDPVRPRVHEAERVAEADAGVCVRAAVRRHPARERAEEDREHERPDRRQSHRHERDRPVRSERRRQVEDADADDRAHDQGDRSGQSETIRLLGRSRCRVRRNGRLASCRSTSRDCCPGLAAQHRLSLRDRPDHRRPAGLLDEPAGRFHLRPHRALGELRPSRAPPGWRGRSCAGRACPSLRRRRRRR